MVLSGGDDEASAKKTRSLAEVEGSPNPFGMLPCQSKKLDRRGRGVQVQ